MRTSAVPVLDKDGEVVLYDIFIDNEWHGSRRLLRYAEDYINGHISRTVDPAGIAPRDPGVLLA
jgi:hypothetical protein